jgi:DNA-binding transcriptional LysR family regulator
VKAPQAGPPPATWNCLLELSWLEDFTALVECQNFSRAAERRNMTQPAFSRRVRALEDWVGTPLFDRGSHRISLTPAGEQFRAVAQDVLRRLYQGRQQALETGHAATSALRFAATHALSLTFFPAWMRKLEEKIHLGQVELVADNMAACERIMLEGQAQFLICHHHPAAATRFDNQDFVSVSLGDDMLIPVTARNGPGTPLYQLPGTPDAPLPYLAYNEKSGIGRIIASARAQDGLPCWLAPVFTSHLGIVLKTLAADGRGIVWSPESLVRDDLADGGRLMRAGDPDWDIPVEIRLFRPRAGQNEKAEHFWAALTGQTIP